MKFQEKKIIIFGGSGLVGSAIVAGLTKKYSLCTPAHGEIDVTNKKQISDYVENIHPDFIIYGSGLASVDVCEEYSDRATLLNSTAPGFIARLGVPMVYISSDAVFDGKPRTHPYMEDDTPHPFSVYGETKLKGEEAVRAASDNNIILRIVSVFTYRIHKRIDFMRQAVHVLSQYTAITDQQLNPLLLDALPRAVDAIISAKMKGIFHLGSTDSATNLEIITRVARLFRFNRVLVRPVMLDTFLRGKTAKRGSFCVLDVSKFQRLVRRGILPDIETSIQTFATHYEYP
jgi:dTDP-4-dehydrorhamnose reductase